ncbi:hypothetical protein [Vibrio sp. WXL103]|uniref:hypothetical protein n=1 Tax=Vibrio sp. WXL103 TaxID=3450710 RepID=UPI003EC54524
MKLKTLSILISAAASAALLTGCNSGGNKDIIEDEIEGETVAELNIRIGDANEGETVYLEKDGNYSSGIIYLNKAITLDGENVATITGNACINVSAPGAEIKQLSFAVSGIGQCESEETSQGRSGAVTIMPIGEEDNPVVLSDLKFDGSGYGEDDLTNKASLVYSGGYFELYNSSFENLQASIQNNAVYVPCHKDTNKMDIVIENNTFSIGSGDKETAAIKLGNSSGAAITTEECNVTIFNNTFENYTTDFSADLSQGTSQERVTAIFATEGSVANDALNDNVFL